MGQKNEAFEKWLAHGSPKAADEYQKASEATAKVVADAKTQMCEEFGKVMEIT